MKLKLFLLTALAILLIPASVQAASFSVRLGQPKSPTNQNNFKLTFVALDTQETGRNISVKCFKKGPSDSGYSQFDTTKILIEGGNTDSCAVTDGILNSNGTYSFYVEGAAGSETISTLPVSVDYNTSGPSDPSDYSKERINSCDYKIKFKTANDSKTIKVQLFRSDNLSIQVNAGAVVATKMVGPNTESEIINSVPDCNKEWYFVIRAVDSSDNVSGTVGDRFTTTTSSSTTSPTTTTGSGTAGSAGSVGGSGAIIVDSTASQVTEQNATASGDTPAVIEGSTTTPSPEVLGTATDSKKNLYKWLLIFTAVLAGYFISRSLRQAKK